MQLFRFQSALVMITIANLFVSCNQLESPVSTDMDAHAGHQHIQRMGLRTDMVEDYGDFYLVEGCIAVDKAHKATERQWHTSFLVARPNVRNIRVFIDPSIPTTGVDNWRPAIQNAVNEWNNIFQCIVTLTVVNNLPAEIVVQADGNVLGNNVIADALFPSNDLPGNRIRINLDFNGNQTITEGQMRYNMVHEIGHCLGFRHTNWQNREPSTDPNIPGSTANLIYGSPNTDGSSVMNGGTAANSWSGFSGWDTWSAQMLYPERFVPGVGTVAEGADIAAGNINGTGGPDIVMMAYDAPSGGNTFRYRVGFDLDANGIATRITEPIIVAGLGNVGEGAGAALGNFNGNANADLLLMAYDAPNGGNTFRYKILYDLNPISGLSTSESPMVTVAGVGNVGEGAGVALQDIDNNGIPEIILMAYDAPSGGNSFRYKIGWNPNNNGVATSWSNLIQANGVGNVGEGAGIAFGNFDSNPRPDMILMAEDAPSGQNQFRYYVGWNVNTSGVASSFSSLQLVTGLANVSNGAGVCVTNLDGNGTPDLIIMNYDDPSGANTFRYKVGFNINSAGTASWQP